MKLINLNIILASLAVIFATSCTQRFEEMNDNDYTSGDMDPKYQFVKAQTKIYTSGHEGYRGNLIMAGPMSMTTMNPQYTQGAGFGRSDSFTEATWRNLYNSLSKDVEDATVRLEAEMDRDATIENQAKLAQMAITKVISYYRTTTMYGDIPYSEAGKGMTEGIFYPEYDKQEDIFRSMIEELKIARENLTKGNTFSDDVYYFGDPSKWARLANSMLIKIGMAMSAADPAWGEEVVTDAVNHPAGYISDLSDSAVLEHNDSGGPWGETINGSGVANEGRVGGQSYQFFSEAMLVSLQKRRDPRIFWVASHIDNTGSETRAFLDTTAYTNFDPFKYAEDGGKFEQVHYRGARSGDRPDGNRGLYEFDGQVKHMAFTIASEVDGKYVNNLGYTFNDQGQYAQLVAVNPATIMNSAVATIVVGADEINFLLAEAAQRGWAVPGSAIDYYTKGVEAAVRKYPSFYAAGQDYVNNFVGLYERQQDVVYNWENEATSYVGRMVDEFSQSGDKLNTIIYQHWVSQIGNGYNAFTLWNRTHLPEQVPYYVDASARDIQVPVYTQDPQENPNAQPTGSLSVVELHTGGYTNGYRPSRFPYPAREFTVNPSNVSAAISNQETYGNPSSDFLTAPQWMSKKN